MKKIKIQYKQNKTIHKLFEEQAKAHPQAIALTCNDQELTYEELNERSNQLAYYLIEQGVKADTIVAICLERSLEMIIGLLAVLKAGGAYLPIDPNYPIERIEYTLNDSHAKIVLTQESLVEKLLVTKVNKICINEQTFKKYSTNNPLVEMTSSSLAYVIYTSGTTGRPKGVMLEHVNVERLFLATKDDFNFNQKDVWTLFHSFAFDFAVWEIWGALLHGGRLVIVPYSVSRSPENFYKLLITEKVTVLNQTPSAFKQIAKIDKQYKEEVSSLRYVVFGGEKLNFSSLSSWYEKYSDTSPVMVNMYGITETTVHTTYRTLCKEDVSEQKSLIGMTLNDLGCYILDDNYKLVTKGIIGELYITGAGLARGYLGQPKLTEERFMQDLFSPELKMYKTGDLVRYMEDGDIEYIGRTDDQVQIRGFRIELGEIEQQILAIVGIKESIVISKLDIHGELALFGYVVMEDNTSFNLNSIKTELLKKLTAYMIPSAIIALESMPLTSNGKVDKKALVAIDIKVESLEEYIAPRTETEVTLASIFKKILKVERIGIEDSFFDLGGHSILAVQLISEINNFFNTSLAFTVLFQASTVKTLSLWIQTDSQENKILTPIQTKGNKRIIFGLPGAGGSTVIYKVLSETMGETQPFYGLDVLYPTSSSSAVDGVMQIAKENIKAIKSIQPHGPYRLMGYCMGSLVAYEMARILKGEIESIVMINTSVPQRKNYKQLFHTTKSLSKFEIKKILNKMSRMQIFSFAKHKLEHHSKTQMVPYSVLAYDYYRFKPMEEDLNILLLCIKGKNENMVRNSLMKKYGWTELIDKKVSVNYIDGEHLTVLLSENVLMLNETINTYYSDLDKE